MTDAQASPVRPTPAHGQASLVWALAPFVLILGLGLTLVHYWKTARPAPSPWPAEPTHHVEGIAYEWLATVHVEKNRAGSEDRWLSHEIPEFRGGIQIHIHLAHLPPGALAEFTAGARVRVVGRFSGEETTSRWMKVEGMMDVEVFETTLTFADCRIRRAEH